MRVRYGKKITSKKIIIIIDPIFLNYSHYNINRSNSEGSLTEASRPPTDSSHVIGENADAKKAFLPRFVLLWWVNLIIIYILLYIYLIYQTLYWIWLLFSKFFLSIVNLILKLFFIDINIIIMFYSFIHAFLQTTTPYTLFLILSIFLTTKGNPLNRLHFFIYTCYPTSHFHNYT